MDAEFDLRPPLGRVTDASIGPTRHRRQARTFDFGLDNTECGNVKFLDAQEADDLCPYICDLEYVYIKAMGYGVRRTKTLGWGCDRCDFRFFKHGVTSAPWPPEFAERTCGEPKT